MKNKLYLMCGIRSDRRLVVDLLAILFGVGSWLGINSVYVQLPLLVGSAPEGWNLPSYLVVIIQLGNIGPILYTAALRWKSFRDSYLIMGLLLLGSCAAMVTAFIYDQTVHVFDADRSVPLFITVFALSLVGCTSSVLFMPYMGRFKDIYLITYLIGEGFSGFVPSIVALIQGVGGNGECRLVDGTDPAEPPKYESYTPPPRFGTRPYFIISSAILAVSLIAFVLLDRLGVCRGEYAAVTIGNGNNYAYNASSSREEDCKTPTEMVDDTERQEPSSLVRRNYLLLMLLISVMCLFGNGFFPSVQSYSCLPYGNVAYHLTVTLSSMANPAACFLAFFLPKNSVRSIVALSSLLVPFAAYALTTAITSPDPPLMHNVLGDIFVVACWTIMVGLVSYVRLVITTLLRCEGGQTLVWVGVASQLGSLVGSILSFTLVNFTDTFQQYYPC
ncbi:solute carrier family 52, riboflavin transporter, member 3-A [Anopheles nili]|uniref:solute carrier family 52, riboflavin transporter, member 3-A n=1 Tax=Anopheles nili TaxID=185578 RepID=UPI00237B06BE|nr:solute carrier family 52, riboflavin transporter, member 3-A [Anopheles nili]